MKSVPPEQFERENQVLELRKSGATWAEIASVTGYANASGAQKAYSRVVTRVQRESLDELRDLELERLDRLQRSYWKAAVIDGDKKAAEFVLKVIAQRTKLLGLDAPQRIDVQQEVITYDGDAIQRETAAIVELVRVHRGAESALGGGTGEARTVTDE